MRWLVVLIALNGVVTAENAGNQPGSTSPTEEEVQKWQEAGKALITDESYEVDPLTCDYVKLENCRPKVPSIAIRGTVKLVVDPQDFDSQVSVQVTATEEGFNLDIPGIPAKLFKSEEILVPLDTYYDKCTILHLRDEPSLMFCVKCKAHRNLWMNSIAERVLSRTLSIEGRLPIIPEMAGVATEASDAEMEKRMKDEEDAEENGENVPGGVKFHILPNSKGELPEVILDGVDVMAALFNQTTSDAAEGRLEEQMVKISDVLKSSASSDPNLQRQEESVDLMALLSDKEDHEEEEQLLSSSVGSNLPRKIERAVQKALSTKSARSVS